MLVSCVFCRSVANYQLMAAVSFAENGRSLLKNTSVKAHHLNKQGDWLSKEPDVFRRVQMSATTARHALAAWFPARQ